MNLILFVDTETNGLPKNYKAPVTLVDNWPRVIQLAWALYAPIEGKWEKVSGRCDLIKPDKWTIPKEKFWIDNGYSTEQSLREGIEIFRALSFFMEALDQATHLVAHNMQFDAPIVGAEMIRAALKSDSKPKRICTMQSSTAYCAIPHKDGNGTKWPRLEELHVKLFGCNFEGAHDAGKDVGAMVKCFFELEKRNVIRL